MFDADHQRPFLKWVGGKTQIISTITSDFPKEVNHYHELFLGGGSVLLAFMTCVHNRSIKLNGSVYAYDANSTLIHLYKTVKSSPNELYDQVMEYANVYSTVPDEASSLSLNVNIKKPTTYTEAMTCKESYYYWIRERFNALTIDEKHSLQGAAMFLFLNKTCFRGLFREGPRGFNVPFGNYKKPAIISKTHLLSVSQLIQTVHFRVMKFEESMNQIESNDFVYMDPPYAPENAKSFVNYTQTGFSVEDHKKLFELTKNLRNVKVMMSNSDVSLVTEAFQDPGFDFNIKTIVCKRSINSKKPSSKTNEVIIKNY